MDLTGIPLRVKGKAEITDENGDVNETEGKMVALCRCGQSANKPFCLQEDGDFTWRVSDCEKLVESFSLSMQLIVAVVLQSKLQNQNL